MVYISFNFYLFVVIALVFYYICPMKMRWCILLLADIMFYLSVCKSGLLILFATVLVSYVAALSLERCHGTGQKLLLAGAVILLIGPWFLARNGNFESYHLIVPIGISFYTMQIIAYLTDVCRGEIAPQKNLAKYALFVTFFHRFYRDRFRDMNSWGSSCFRCIYLMRTRSPEDFT